MLSPLEALDALPARHAARPHWPTGFAAVDEMTGGFDHEHVWIIIGTPGQGRSTLATQWALLLATRHGLETVLVSGREPAHLVGTRLLSAAGKVPALSIWNQDVTERDQPRIDRAYELLATAPLRIATPGEPTMLTGELPEALVVDDADLEPGLSLQRVASLAGRGMLLVLTLPRHHVLTVEGIDPDWARVADFVIDIDRADLLDHETLRAGEADLHLVRNRWGPCRTTTVAFQGHYARFVDLAP